MRLRRKQGSVAIVAAIIIALLILVATLALIGVVDLETESKPQTGYVDYCESTENWYVKPQGAQPLLRVVDSPVAHGTYALAFKFDGHNMLSHHNLLYVMESGQKHSDYEYIQVRIWKYSQVDEMQLVIVTDGFGVSGAGFDVVIDLRDVPLRSWQLYTFEISELTGEGVTFSHINACGLIFKKGSFSGGSHIVFDDLYAW